MCQQNGMLVSHLNCLVLKELNKKRKQKKVIEDMTVIATNIFQTFKLQSPGLVLTKNIQNSRVGHWCQSVWMDVHSEFWCYRLLFFYILFSRNNQKNIKILSPENIYVQLFRIEPPNVKPIGHPNRYLTIRW